MTYDPRTNTTFKSWDPSSDAEYDAGACGKGCHPQACMDEYEGYTIWQCQHGDWFFAQEQPQICVTEKHSHMDCPGNCAQHPLMEGSTLEISQRMRSSGPSTTTWGEMMYEEEQAYLAAETAEERAARLRAEAEHERKNKEGVVKYLVHRKEEKWTKGGEMKFRVPRPCKYATLYAQRICSDCGAKVPEGETVCKAMKGHRVCDQEFAGCWNHEQTRTCIYVHPDEPQWADACSGALCYDRQAQCFHLRGAEPAQVNRFQAAARQEQRPHAGHQHSGQQRQGGYQSAGGRQQERPNAGHQHSGQQRQTRAQDEREWEQAGKRSRR